MKPSANVEMFLAEDKWSALSGRDQLWRSVLAHSAMATAIVFLAGVDSTAPQRIADSTSIRLEFRSPTQKTVDTKPFPVRAEQFSPVRTPADDEASGSVNLTPNLSRPEAATEKPPEVTSPTARLGPSIKTPLLHGKKNVHRTQQPITIPLPLETASSSPAPAESSKGPSKTPLSLLTSGAGRRTFGAPESAHSTPTVQVSHTSEALIDTQLPKEFINIDNGSRQGAIQCTPRQTFSELDRQACQAFYRGETIAGSNKEEAKQLWQKAVGLMELALPLLAAEQGAENAEMASALRNVGRCFDRLNEPNKSCEYYKKSASMYRKLEGADSKEFGVSLVFYADALINQGNFQNAEEPLKESLPIYRQAYGDKSEYVAWTYQRLARICNHTKRQAEADRYTTMANALLGK